MESNELTIKLEQRDWERLQKLSERNGEPMERLAVQFLTGDLAKIFNKPSETNNANLDTTPFEEKYLTDAYSKHFFDK